LHNKAIGGGGEYECARWCDRSTGKNIG
jgi:hypothetical protein